MQSSGWRGRRRESWARYPCVLGWIVGLLGLANVAVPALGAELVQLTTGPGNDTEAAWSPDGQRIVFQTDRDGTLDLHILDLATKVRTPLAAGPGHAAFPAWSPDGKWVVYSYACFTKTALEGQEDGYNLFLIPATGGPPRRLTRGRHRDYCPAFLADGKTIWFSSDRGVKDKSNAVSLHAVSVDGGEPKVVLPREGSDRATVQASFSPDGRSFAYGTIAGFRDNWRIVLAHVGSPADGYVLTDAQGCFYGPRWSPVGTVLACTGFRVGDPGWGVWLFDAQTGQRARLDSGQGQSRSPAWSPDGRRLVLENNRSGSYKLYCLQTPELPEAPPASIPIVDRSQVLHYCFAKRSDTAIADSSPRSNHGHIRGTPIWQDGAIRFGPPGASIAIPDAKGFDFGNGAFAVRAVVKAPEQPKFAMIAMGEYPGNRLGWQLYIADDGRAWFNSRTTELAYRGARSDGPLPTRRSVTLTGMRDAVGNVRLYVDGSLQQAAASGALCVYGPPVQVRIGTQYNGTAPLRGWLCDIAVYSRELSAEEARGDSLARFWAEQPPASPKKP
jgi:Tol biopolymer transport system component